MALKCIYYVEMNLYLIYCQELLLSDVGCDKHLPCRHNDLVVSHEIVGSNGQTPITRPNGTDPIPGSCISSDTIYNDQIQSCRYFPLSVQEVLTALKHVAHTYITSRTSSSIRCEIQSKKNRKTYLMLGQGLDQWHGLD